MKQGRSPCGGYSSARCAPFLICSPYVCPQGLVLLCYCSHRDSKRTRERKHRMRSALSVWRRAVLPAVRVYASLLSLLLSLLTERSPPHCGEGAQYLSLFIICYIISLLPCGLRCSQREQRCSRCGRQFPHGGGVRTQNNGWRVRPAVRFPLEGFRVGLHRNHNSFPCS